MKRYLLTLFMTVALVIGLGAGAVWIVNPYWTWSSPIEREDFNRWKPAVTTKLRYAKAWQIWRQRPEALGLGSSRSEFGIDPNHPGWDHRSVYNASLSSATLYEVKRYLQHAHAVTPLKQVVIGLDFFMFAPGHPRSSADFSEQRLLVTADGKQTPWWSPLQRWGVLFSRDGWADAVTTIRQQDITAGTTGYFLPNGQRDAESYWYCAIQPHGCRRAFAESLAEMYENYDRWFHTAEIGAQKTALFSDILTFAHQNGIELHLFISPIHAWLLETIAVVGYWDLFEEWKMSLVATNEAVARNYGAEPLPLWDFATYSPYTTEPVPPADAMGQRMQWFWESSHYQARFGDVVLDQLLGPGAAPSDSGPGTLLTTETILGHLNKTRNAAAAYRQAYPGEIRYIHRVLSRTKNSD